MTDLVGVGWFDVCEPKEMLDCAEYSPSSKILTLRFGLTRFGVTVVGGCVVGVDGENRAECPIPHLRFGLTRD